MGDTPRISSTDMRDVYDRLAELTGQVATLQADKSSITLNYQSHETILKINQQTGRFEIWVDGELKISP